MPSLINRVFKKTKNVGQSKLLVRGTVKPCESSGDVRLEARIPKLNEDNSTSTCKKKLQGSEDKCNTLLTHCFVIICVAEQYVV